MTKLSIKTWTQSRKPVGVFQNREVCGQAFPLSPHYPLLRRVFALALIYARPECGKALCRGALAAQAKFAHLFITDLLRERFCRTLPVSTLQTNSIFPCVCSKIDRRWCKNEIRTKKSTREDSRVWRGGSRGRVQWVRTPNPNEIKPFFSYSLWKFVYLNSFLSHFDVFCDQLYLLNRLKAKWNLSVLLNKETNNVNIVIFTSVVQLFISK